MEHSITRSYVGSTMYMAPERIRGGAYRIESDIWSFGLSLWELAVGQFPLPASEDAVLTTYSVSIPILRSCIESIVGHPRQLQALINGCLQHDVQLRWKLDDLSQSNYITEAYPIDHGVIKDFITRKMNA